MEYEGTKCTVISIVPFPITNEDKPGLYPGRFSIPAASGKGIPQVLVVTDAVCNVPVPGQKVPIAVPTPSREVAKSIVEDYIDSQLVADSEARPGLAWLPGELTPANIITKHSDLLNELNEKQMKWFLRLVELADTDWNRYKSHRVITDFQRYACKRLNLEREWAIVVETQVQKCPACGSPYTSGQVVCATCRCVLDKEHYAKLQFAT